MFKFSSPDEIFCIKFYLTKRDFPGDYKNVKKKTF